MEEESSWKKPDDSARISFMVPTDKMRSLTKADKSTRSEARLSRYGYKLLLSIYQCRIHAKSYKAIEKLPISTFQRITHMLCVIAENVILPSMV